MSNNKTATSKVKDTVSKSVNFEITIADIARRSERRAWWVAGSALVLCLIMACSYFYVLPLKEKVPYLVMADAYTGTSTVARLRDDFRNNSITTSEAINRSNVAHYVLARESYDYSIMNLRDWTTVYTMSEGDVLSSLKQLYGSAASPYKIYGKERAIRVKINSIVLIGGNGKPYKGATVRLQRSIYNKVNGGTSPLDNKIATLEFTYDSNLQMSDQARIENPLGFQVTSYRTDNDYASPAVPEVPTAPAPQAAPPAAASPDAAQPAVGDAGVIPPPPGTVPQQPLPATN
ncbi:virB8 family protein [Luteimonas aquatica]|uniref:virB8 family protein n=1 Tax=Luteimonas aquatica TaxID=450364 RepID=UPI001F55DF9A|nr:type IV secretion system protein [Luteimonas aquatica]